MIITDQYEQMAEQISLIGKELQSVRAGDEFELRIIQETLNSLAMAKMQVKCLIQHREEK